MPQLPKPVMISILFIVIAILGFGLGYVILTLITSKQLPWNIQTTSFQGPNDPLLDQVPQQQEYGKIYYYKELDNISSTLNGKILGIDLTNSVILVGNESESVWIHLNSHTQYDQITSSDGKSQSYEGGISTLKTGEFVSVAEIKYQDNKYYAGRLAKII